MLSDKQLANEMLRECRVVETLDKYGEVRLHGAYEMDLMTWPEVDVWVLNDEFQASMTWDMIGDLARTASPTHVHVINQIDHALEMTPPYSVSVDYRFYHRGMEWKLDVCAGSHQRHAGDLEYLDHVRPQLTPEKREAILALKHLAAASSAYRKSRWRYTSGRHQFVGIDIYRAVLVDGIRSPAEFAAYLWQHRGIDVSHDFGVLPGSISIIASP